MLFPFRTDAPIYYWPFVTVGLIVVNTLIFMMCIATNYAGVEPFVLEFGEGLYPNQWLTNIFLHAGPMHLIGNMIWLWAFGLIVEGKLGWWKFLLVYLGIGMAQSAVAQIIMLGGSGGAVGASGAIFGLVAISLIWAPKNDMYCVLFIFVVPRVFEISVMWLAGGYLIYQVAIVALTRGQMSSELLHVLGAFFGLGVGIWLLVTKRVDCEGWDLFSVLGGKHNRIHHELGGWRAAQEAVRAEALEEKPQGISRDAALAQMQEILASGNSQLALVAHRRLLQMEPEWRLPAELHLKLIAGLLKEGEWQKAAETMKHYLEAHREKAALVRIKLAEVLITRLERPTAGLKVLANISLVDLSPQQAELAARLQVRASELKAEGVFEFEGDEI